MYKYSVILFLCFTSCIGNKNDDPAPRKIISGNWLILYPQHILKNDAQRKLYQKAQDSIVNLMGLKLISFEQTGGFFQMDSLFGLHGNWSADDSGDVRINNAGRGFERFYGKVAGILHDTILIREVVLLGNEKVNLVWHLKNIDEDDEAASLFERSKNSWRQRPVKKETLEEIRRRVVAMLRYYADYFKIVSVESIYFSSVRVFLPFNYYQHAIGLKDFEAGDPFINCFFDGADAHKGYELIKSTFEKTTNEDFPSGENFVIEYAMYFEKLAKEIE